MFFYNSNMVAGYSNPKYLEDCLSNLELSVAIDIQRTETCQACDYVLPDTSYLERLEVPEFIGGKIPAVSLRDQVIEKIHPNTKDVYKRQQQRRYFYYRRSGENTALL